MLKRSAFLRQLLVWIVIVASGSLLFANPLRRGGEFKFVAQLQNRQLYQLAETFCRQQLAIPEVAAAEETRIEWGIRLIEALTMQAINQPEKSGSEQVWDRITEVRDVQRASTNDVVLQGRLELNFQLAQLWRATWQASMASTASDPTTARRAAVDRYRQIARELASMDERLQANRPSSRGSHGPNPIAWKQLRTQLQYKLAETNQRQAEVYPHGSPDNVLLLTQAENTYSTIARLKPNSAITLASEFGAIECLRLLGKLDEVALRLQQFPASELRGTLANKHVIETAEWLCARGQPEPAANLLVRELERNSNEMPQDIQATMQVALIRAYVVAARNAVEAEKSAPGGEATHVSANQWQSRAVSLLNRMEEHQSAYWIRKAESLLIDQPTTERMESDLQSDMEIMAKRANNLYHRDEFDEAIKTFQLASIQAREAGLDERAFDFDFQAAAVMHETKQTTQAITAFQRLATQQVQHPRAAQAHWLAVINAASLVGRSADAPVAANALALYQELLAEHLRLWPTAKTANSAALWLGRLVRQQGDTAKAVNVLQQVAVDSAEYFDTMVELRASYLSSLADGELSAAQRKPLAEQAIAAFQRSLGLPRPDLIDTTRRAYATIAAVEFSLLFTDTDAAATAQPLLTGSLAHSCHVVDNNRVEALLGLACVLSETPGFAATARQHWTDVQWKSDDWVPPLLRRLSQKAIETKQRNATSAAAIAELEFELIDRLLAVPSLGADRSIQKLKAESLIRTDQRAAAITVYQQLAAANGGDPQLLADLAALWEAGEAESDWSESLATWRAMSRASTDGSEDWFRAKLGIARTLVKLGDQQRARESLLLLQALHPNLGGPRLKPQFLQVLSECK